MHAEHICQRFICFASCVNVRRTTHADVLHPLCRTFASSVPSFRDSSASRSWRNVMTPGGSSASRSGRDVMTPRGSSVNFERKGRCK